MASQRGASTGNQQRLLVFGPQPLSHDAANFRSVHKSLKQASNSSWIFHTIKDLSTVWHSFLEEFPKYSTTQTSQGLAALEKWSENGTLPDTYNHLPNIVLSPLLVIIHLWEYLQYEGESSKLQPTETLGFCMGFLSAIAVSASKKGSGIETYGSVAIRLATLVGGIVDVQDALDPDGASQSLATAWSPGTSHSLDRVLGKFPEVSVVR